MDSGARTKGGYRRFAPDEEKILKASTRAGHVPPCPRCSGVLERRTMAPAKAVPYVRTRTWLLCPHCSADTVLDVRVR